MQFRYPGPWIAFVLLLVAVPAAAHDALTFREETDNANLAILCSPAKARNGDKEQKAGKTTVFIEEIYKGHALLGDNKTIVIDESLPPGKNGKARYIAWINTDGKLFEVHNAIKATPPVLAYYQQVLKRKDEPPGKRIAFYFAHLEDDNDDIAQDALWEFERAGSQPLATLAGQMSPDSCLTMLKKRPDMEPAKLRVYVLLLGACGRKEHAAALEELLARHLQGKGSAGVESILVGLTLLDAERGWGRITDFCRDRDKDFAWRYQALKALRFLHENRPDIVGKEKVVHVLAALLPEEEMADFAVEDLRKLKCWDMTDRVLAVGYQETHQTPVVQRAILRFALQSPAANAQKFVRDQRQKDAASVEAAEQLLKLETGAPDR